MTRRVLAPLALSLAKTIARRLRDAGFDHVTLDLASYRAGGAAR